MSGGEIYGNTGLDDPDVIGKGIFKHDGTLTILKDILISIKCFYI